MQDIITYLENWNDRIEKGRKLTKNDARIIFAKIQDSEEYWNGDAPNHALIVEAASRACQVIAEWQEYESAIELRDYQASLTQETKIPRLEELRAEIIDRFTGKTQYDLDGQDLADYTRLHKEFKEEQSKVLAEDDSIAFTLPTYGSNREGKEGVDNDN